MTDYIWGPIGFGLSLLLFHYFIGSRLQDRLERRLILWAFLIKSVMVVGFALLYEFYYGQGDVFYYFHSACNWNDLLWSQPNVFWEYMTTDKADLSSDLLHLTSELDIRSGSTKWVKLYYSLLLIPQWHSYLFTSFIGSFLSFFGLYQIYLYLKRKIQGRRTLLILGVFYIPSFLFWCSGLLKESILLASMGCLFYVFRKPYSFKGYILALVGVFLIYHIKAYILISLLLSIILGYIMTSIVKGRRLALILVLAGIIATLYSTQDLGIYMDRMQLDLLAQIVSFQESQIMNARFGAGSGYQLAGELGQGFSENVRLIWQSFIVTLLRPYPWEINQFIMLIQFIENIILVLLLYLGFYRNGGKYSIQSAMVLYSMMSFIVIMAVLVGLTSFNFGSLSRYRIFILCPLVLCASHYLSRWKGRLG